ncbi:BTB/POZ-like domain and FYVE zinc finger domain and Ankyrin repeat and Zinc finger, FYVE/PHD-type domain and BTB/POZ fold domain and BTB/POZ domain and Zinc finger, RING/FYVE/PHD-type domain and Zinc finger, FYVE-related domain and Ankyrin repeat-containing domain-containing protein [Strongyloides ratti]|uniref:Ankyrin repeat and FYVE domain-containing protein 1 n=1 Tax=Strongyloides ratti TaxID=34506 RepID=A0A090LBD8_STRRB|nr:BTB/POZ-like domain and FYVE zinc finger domain and Ankyrin repeat and Zinc finger, FYVE/PHD-type domain and BTB/POZ fold domain and BTB/POZ domain and Zinc finger, RING/FYVE/PHD-type domain and Zinc finger, FYVE-related domain and Ankyrin repeat-containing domain-containing protein [Strongyloides ratti]CEF65443.1 BTB/POZ-like domain and FYVE zinc finger domain and Ankyrin repeat and Zinc finger, FYVE/PHD-type domain and BTB/POZ fold domain and BTB/POZ domain and Zinc finger, RING/FYVE/PHD-type
MSDYLGLLRKEHVELQEKYNNLLKKYNSTIANSKIVNDSEEVSFIYKLAKNISQLFDSKLYSDVTIKISDLEIKAHKIVITSHTNRWDPELLVSNILELTDIKYKTVYIIFKWMYKDELDDSLTIEEYMDVLSGSKKFKLDYLVYLCESALINKLETDNCICIYQFSENENLERLRKHCINIVSERWDDFKPEHFSSLSPKLLYEMVKGHSSSVLSSIIRLQREDVLFLFLIENGQELEKVINEYTDKDELPLGLALKSKQFSMAKTLVENKCNINATYKDGKYLLFEAIEDDNIEAVEFLVSHGVHLGAVQPETNETLLHTFASSTSMTDGMLKWATSQINKMDFVNQLDNKGRTPLFIAIDKNNKPIIDLLLKNDQCDVNISNIDKITPLEVCLFEIKDLEICEKLVKKGANINSSNGMGQSLLHIAVMNMNIEATKFITSHNGNVNILNNEDEILEILQYLVNETSNLSIQDNDNLDTVIHLAVDKIEVLQKFSDYKVDLTIINYNKESPLKKALINNHFHSGKLLIDLGSDINEKNEDGETLLVLALKTKNCEMAKFLIHEGEIAVDNNLTEIVDTLCRSGVNINRMNEKTSLPPLWRAIEKELFEVAEILFNYGCDVEGWAEDEEKTCIQTLLHKAIDQSNQKGACFLIEHGSNVNALKKYHSSSDDDKQNPLHMSVIWGLTDDGDGRTPAHLAIQEQDIEILKILLSTDDVSFLNIRDKLGMTPLALAMKLKNVNAAKEIVNRLPHAAVQVNGNGENLLHCAVKNDDLEGVFFLLGLQIDVNIFTQDKYKFTALHLVARTGNEMIMRNLVLAGARLNSVSEKGLTAMHIAAYHGHSTILQILIENGAECNIVDTLGNSPLHSAVLGENDECFKKLLIEGVSPKISIIIYNILKQFTPDYPLEIIDAEGNTVFLLSYIHGNGDLCRLLTKSNVCVAITNNQGESIFNIETPTKQLLYGLLDSLQNEPKWAEGETCLECKTKFTLTMRKHHCRHCGRLVCSKCSEKTMPLIKYGIQKPVRICEICHDVLTVGVEFF